MVVGFNHNFRYKDVLYHIQTEDGGIKNPVIITHLFDGGTILATKKTSYADIIKADSLDQVVEDLMKEQHREMLRRLRKGEFDRLIERIAAGSGGAVSGGGGAAPPSADSSVPAAAAVAAEPEVVPPLPPVAPPTAPAPVCAAMPPRPAVVQPAPPAPPIPGTAVGTTTPAPDVADRVLEKSLDDIILSYLLGEDKSG